MSGQVERRAASGLVNLIQKLLRGSDYTNPLRFADGLAARTQPPPDIPGGPYHKTSKIYYFSRDARREVEPPMVIPTDRLIGASSQVAAEVKPATPGRISDI